MSKYKITLNHLEDLGGIKRLESDGFTKTEIMNAVHQQTDQQNFNHKTRTDQNRIVSNLFDRSKE